MSMKRLHLLPLAALTAFLASSGAVRVQSAPAKPVILSPEALTSKVQALKQEQVAWRKVEWRTCLIEGLKESREQGKPIMLWIFIDRPIDDERC